MTDGPLTPLKSKSLQNIFKIFVQRSRGSRLSWLCCKSCNVLPGHWLMACLHSLWWASFRARRQAVVAAFLIFRAASFASIVVVSSTQLVACFDGIVLALQVQQFWIVLCTEALPSTSLDLLKLTSSLSYRWSWCWSQASEYSAPRIKESLKAARLWFMSFKKDFRNGQPDYVSTFNRVMYIASRNVSPLLFWKEVWTNMKHGINHSNDKNILQEKQSSTPKCLFCRFINGIEGILAFHCM